MPILSIFPTLNVEGLGTTTGTFLSPVMDLLSPIVTIAITVIAGLFAVIFLLKLIIR